MLNLTEMVRDGKMSDFVMCRDKALWYKTREEGFEYPVPFEELPGGTFLTEMKSITMMRFIRKQLAFDEECRKKIEEAKA